MEKIKSIALYSDICIVLQDETHARYDETETSPKMTRLPDDRHDRIAGDCCFFMMSISESLWTDQTRQEDIRLIRRSYTSDGLCYQAHEIQERYPDSYQRSSQESGL